MTKKRTRRNLKSKLEARFERAVERILDGIEGRGEPTTLSDFAELYAALGKLDMPAEHAVAATKPTPRVLPFCERAFRITKAEGRTRHMLGGRTKAAAPSCGACQRPLLRFANLDAKAIAEVCEFARLPLYFCCHCPGPVYYTLNGHGLITTIRTRPSIGEEAPFQDSPSELPRGYVKLIPIGAVLNEAISNRFSGVSFELLPGSLLKEITKLMGQKPTGWSNMYFSQFGGFPRSYQGGREGTPRICPNNRCAIRRRTKPEFKYRPLAVLDLWNDKFWGIKPLDAVQVVYSICPGCKTIAAKYTCT